MTPIKIQGTFFLGHAETGGILAPQPETESMPPAVEAQNLNHWTTRKVPHGTFYQSLATILVQ